MKRASLIVLSSAFVLFACTDHESGAVTVAPTSDATDATGDGTSDATGDSLPSDSVSGDTVTVEDVGLAADAEVIETFDPYTLVPAEAVLAEANEACPEGFVDGPVAEGQHEGYLAAEQQRSFHLLTPDAESVSGPRPLLVAFNGTGGNGAGFIESANLAPFVEKGFIVVAPDSNANGTVWPVWDAMRIGDDEGLPNPDLDYIDSLITCLAAHHEVDVNRIYLTGHSAGGLMANRVLRARSEVFAGGIVGSGVYDLTAPDPAPPLDAMAVIVTWGGDNDSFTGDSDDPDVAVPEINFVEQASVASLAYEAAEGVHQVACHADNEGHTYLPTISAWAADFLLMHPKGAATHENYTFEPPTELDSTITCTEEPYTYIPPVVVECPVDVADPVGCYDYCQFSADCVVENGTVSGPLGPQMSALGFSGEDYAECGGCIETCEADVAEGLADDTAVLDCWTEATANVCSAGVTGAMPFINAVNTCCLDALESAVCTRLCTTVMQSDVASDFFKDTCAPWAPEEE